MKKTICSFITIVMLFAFVSCSQTQEYVNRYPLDIREERADRDYKNIVVKDNEGNDISEIVVDLWFAANEIYNVDDSVMFEIGEETRIADNMPEFFELLNYNEVVDSVFTENAIQQLEQTGLGGSIPFIQKVNDKVYRQGSWKTGFSFAYALESMKAREVQENKIILEVQYDRLGEMQTVDFTIVKINNEWLVDNYIYPETYRK